MLAWPPSGELAIVELPGRRRAPTRRIEPCSRRLDPTARIDPQNLPAVKRQSLRFCDSQQAAD
ncbi:hypothetical protein CKO40_04935 [Halochromatium glycolicum]|uniref:Uncharacterized protein n=1 Tax=Halochromatium glycolicum TaxID=85075 RepID=A0AAJ0U260_9GAMM|nr:hypothetical protein [Halochromatium glycolicum]